MKCWWKRRRHTPEISLLVPFRADDEGRQRNWDWLREYWKHELPAAEIVIGKDWKYPFSKTAAVNYAAKRARGNYFVILDADAYLSGMAIMEAVARIKAAKRRGRNIWFVPYRRLMRLTEEATFELLQSDPTNDNELVIFTMDDFLPTEGSHHGRRFGAMCQVLPREAFFAAGGMDPRFRGWGGEDVSFVRAVDTMWGHHKTIDADIYHLYHTKLGTDWRDRTWRGQYRPRINEGLATRYDAAYYQYEVMAALVAEFKRANLIWWRRR